MTHDSHETSRLDPSQLSGVLARPGDLLRDRYHLDEQIGRGGMGVVFRATDTELRREVAVKVLPEGVTDPESRERLLGEARAAAALNHPGVVSVYDVGEHAGVPFFVMELVAGPSLGERPPAEWRRSVRIALQLCEALEHAHGHGLVHRDLKPDNILYTGGDGSDAVKLADLGLAVPARGSRLTQVGAIAGTVAYMAPEQALGRPVDGRADLYALGVVLYELGTGRLPFTGDDPLAVVSQHVHAPVVPPRALAPTLPRAVETVILRLMAKDPDRRYGAAAEVAVALESALASPDGTAEEAGAAVALLDALSRGRLVGRSAELGEARDLWRRALDGRGHCVLVSGEPGAGKTRLSRELLIQAELDGAAVLTGGCYEFEAATPYLPFVEAFRRWVRERDDDALRDALAEDAARITKLAPDLDGRLGPFPEPGELPPHEERLLFFDAVADVFRRIARRRGLLFYIDDIHWADSGTLILLGHLLRQLRDERVLFTASYRETELDRAHPLAKALVDWNRERLTTRIALRRFGPTETRSQLEALLGEDVTEELGNAVHRETEGNPFFIEEVLKALIEAGSFRREGGRWERCEVPELIIPQSMKEAIANRLDRVGPECNDVLRAAAILGKVFSFQELSVAAEGTGEDALLDALDEAVAAQLLIADRDESFVFTHDKIREVLYEELNPIRRRRVHKRTAEGLERLGAAVETLAHHFVEAGEYERGLEYAKRAAAEAERVFAYYEAVAALERALECAEALEQVPEQAALHEAIGNVRMLGGELIASAEHFERALRLVMDPVDRARLQVRAAGSLVATGDPRGLEYLGEAKTVIDAETNPLGLAQALATEARYHHLDGKHRRAIELLLQAVPLAEPPSDRQTVTPEHASILFECYAYLAGAHQHLGLFADSDAWARRSIAFGERYQVPIAEAMGYEFLGENAINAGNWKEGLDHVKREREIADRVHSRERRAWTYLVSSLCSMLLGDVERAQGEFEEGCVRAEAIGERRLGLILRNFLGWSLAEQGRLDEALSSATDALTAADESGMFYLRTEAGRTMAQVRYRRGEYEEALRVVEETLEMIGESEARITRLWMGPTHIQTLLALGRIDHAGQALEEYAAMVATCQSGYFDGEVVRMRDLVAAAS